MARDDLRSGINKKKKKKKPALIQSTFLIKYNKLDEVTCGECGFKFIKSMKETIKQHDIFHNQRILGLQITKTIFNKLKLNGKKILFKYNENKLNLKNKKIYCFIVSYEDQQIIKLVADMLKIVNIQWLNDNKRNFKDWERNLFNNKIILLICHDLLLDTYRSIGITTTFSPPKSFEHLKGFHMDIKTSAIDINKPELKLKFGVSRIFVSQEYRRNHLAEFMLDSLLEYGVPGKRLTHWQVGFSQPSNAGGLLLQHWISNSNSSSSGDTQASTVPVYHES